MSAEKVSFRVAGVDGCKAGWFVAVASLTKQDDLAARYELTPRRVFIAESFSEVLSSTVDCILVCVDIPIGLRESAILPRANSSANAPAAYFRRRLDHAFAPMITRRPARSASNTPARS